MQLRRWLQHDAILWELPGHGQAPQLEDDLDVWVAALEDAIQTATGAELAVAVGESLGGLLAIMVDAKRKVAFDPFIEPHETVHEELRQGNLKPWLKPILSKSYVSKLYNNESTIEIVLADEFNAKSPSIVPRDIREKLRTIPNLKVTNIGGGHLLLDEQFDFCEKLVLNQLA